MDLEHPKKFSANYIQTMQDKRCGVCCKPHIIGKQSPESINDYLIDCFEKPLEFIVCKKCGITVHASCYGI